MIRWNWLSIGFVALFAARLLFFVWLERLNTGHLKASPPEVPASLAGYADVSRLEAMAAYTQDNSRLAMIRATIGDAVILSLVVSGLLRQLDGLVGQAGLGNVISGTLFFGLFAMILLLVDAPFDYYDTFVIEEKYGFNRSDRRTWVMDLVKAAFISFALLAALSIPLLWVIEAFPSTWWVWGAAIVGMVQLALMVLYPLVVAPVFNVFEPLHDSELAEKVAALVRRVGMRPGGVYQMDAGKRTGHSNAYVSGLGKTKRIVLFDTLVTTHTHDEILAVLAHELGHARLRHSLKGYLLGVTAVLGAFFLASLCLRWDLVRETFGLPRDNLYLSLLLVAMVLQRVGFFVRPLATALSRHFEKEADLFAVHLLGTGESLATSLKKLASHNYSNLNPHPLYVRFHYSHPPMVERIARLERSVGDAG